MSTGTTCPGKPEFYNLQSHKTFTREFVPSTGAGAVLPLRSVSQLRFATSLNFFCSGWDQDNQFPVLWFSVISSVRLGRIVTRSVAYFECVVSSLPVDFYVDAAEIRIGKALRRIVGDKY